jgi:hypothetical protein
MVSVSSIIIQYSNGNGPASSPNTPFEAVIDSTLPYLFLPNSTCDWLKEKLGLDYDEITGLYTITQTNLDSNRADIAHFTFSLGPSKGTAPSNSIVSINFPYDAFNANASWPWGYVNTQPFFPVLRAQSNTAVLGRPFFQEAYVSADYERNTFNVSQTTYSNSGSQIISLYNASTLAILESQSSKKLGAGAIAGIVIGALSLLTVVAILLWWHSKRRSQKIKTQEDPKNQMEMENPAIGRGRSNTFESMSTEVTEIGPTEGRPAHSRHMSGVSEMSSDSEFGIRRNTLGTLDEHVHELEDKTETAEWERNAIRTQNQLQQPESPAELEGRAIYSSLE